MVTPLAPVHTNGTSIFWAPSASLNSVALPSTRKPCSWLGAAPPWLTQPL
jgi:hypothetical protein